jgi:hypothetical protein
MWLNKVGIDTAQEFVLLLLTVATEVFIGAMVLRGEMTPELLFMNPLVGFWLGKNGNGNKDAPPSL